MRSPIIFKLIDWFTKLSPQRKILIIALVLLILFSPWLFFRVMWFYNSSTCTKNGGEWTVGGMAEKPFCLYTYPDGGKSCNSSEQCIGACVIHEPPAQGQLTPIVGVCKENNNPFECYAVIEYPDTFGCSD
jgi:hypothetical protein